jgi:hypothetical protein
VVIFLWGGKKMLLQPQKTLFVEKMSMIGRAYVLPNADMFVPSVAQFVGADRSVPTASLANPQRGEQAAAPMGYVGNYPVMSEDASVLMWASPCDVMAQAAQSRPW